MSNKSRIALFIILIAIFYAVNNYFIIKDNLPIPVHPDEAGHLISNLKHYNILLHPSPEMFMDLLKVNTHYPPLFPFSAAILNIFFGPSRVVSIMTNIIYFLIMLFSIYFIGKKIKDRNTGLLACFILSMFPMIFGMSRWFMLEFALTAMVSFSMYWLLYSENFSNRKYSILFSLFLGLGMLTKGTFIFYIIGPFIYLLLSRKKKNFINLTYVIIIGLLVSLVWYPIAFGALGSLGWIESFREANIRPSGIDFPWHSLDGLLFYFRSIFFYQISPFFLVLLLLTLIFFIKSKVKNKGILIVWILASYIILTIIGNKSSHYIMPVLPAVALILAIGILTVPFRKLRYALVTLVILGGIFQFFYVSYVSYRPIERFIDSVLVNLKLMRYPICVQNMWDYTDRIPYAFYVEKSKLINYRIIPYIKKASMEKEDLVIGTIDHRYYSLNQEIQYLLLKDRWRDIPIIELWSNPDKFLELQNRMDLIFIIHSNRKWLDEYDSEKRFFKEDVFDKKLDLEKKFKIAEIERIGSDAYLFILTNSDKIDLKIIAKNNFYSRFLQPQERKTIISKQPLNLAIKDGIVKIFYNNNEVTKGAGLQTSFYYKNIKYTSSDRGALWEIEKIDVSKILITIDWIDSPVTQFWQLQIDEEGKIDWQIKLETKEKIKLYNIEAQLFLSSDYKNWVSLFKEGRFSKIEPKGWTKVMSLTGSSCLGVKGISNALPNILFEHREGNMMYTGVVLNTDFRIGARVLAFSNTSSVDLDIGKYIFFSGEVFLLDKDRDIYALLKEIKSRKPSIIVKGPLELRLEDGKCKLYYRNTEVTKEAGLNIFFRSHNRPYNSSKAMWRLYKSTPNKLVAKVTWPDLSLVQIWQLEVVRDNIINWQIDMDVREKVKIREGPYVNLILSPNYQRWVSLNNHGKFGSIPRWEKQWSWVGDKSSSNCIGVKKSRDGKDILPSLLLKIEEDLILDHTIPQNTDYSIGARALDVQRDRDMVETLKLDIGRHRIFSGQIFIFERDEDMFRFLKKRG